jgi:putative transposase
VLLRLFYLALTGMIRFLRLLAMINTDKDIKILALRHQLAVLQRQIDRPRLTPSARAFLAALHHKLPRPTLRRLLLFVSPDTVLRWHRDLLRRRHARLSRPQRPGRHPTVRSIRTLVLPLARDNPSWGYRRIHGELALLGIKIAPSTVWEILKTHGIPPAPDRDHLTWATFLRSQAHALLGRRLHRNPHPDMEHDCSSLPSSNTPPVASASSAPPHTPQPGSPRGPATWSWTCRTPTPA